MGTIVAVGLRSTTLTYNRLTTPAMSEKAEPKIDDLLVPLPESKIPVPESDELIGARDARHRSCANFPSLTWWQSCDRHTIAASYLLVLFVEHSRELIMRLSEQELYQYLQMFL